MRVVTIIGASTAAAAAFAIVASAQPNAIDNAMYFRSDVRDDDSCSQLRFDPETQAYVWPNEIINPAMTCPDAFGWTQFTDAIRFAFWNNWAFDSFSWPQEPLPLCGNGITENCCDPNAAISPGYDNAGNPALHCPYFPGDHGGIANATLVPGAHEVTPPAHGIIATTDPARELRQEEAEIVYRNRAFFEYSFRQNLYNLEGLADRFNRASTTVAANAPFRAEGVEIRFPSDAVMFKTDWIHQDYMLDFGLIREMPSGPPNNPDAPYITMMISSAIGDNDASSFKPGLHYLVGVTGAVKALPNWHWYAFEHVGNLGRCDYIGCNDSFGFEQPAPEGFYGNFIRPHTQSDNLVRPSTIFLTGQPYDSGLMTPSLDALFGAIGIATKPSADPNMPSATDEAWRSYRLKGTQTAFTTAYGVPIVLGQSITEGGFINSASCMTCHAQASVNAAGQPAIQSFGSSMLLNLTGYHQSTNGAPIPAWFFSANTNVYQALQTDFVWGIFNAQSVNRTGNGN